MNGYINFCDLSEEVLKDVKRFLFRRAVTFHIFTFEDDELIEEIFEKHIGSEIKILTDKLCDKKRILSGTLTESMVDYLVANEITSYRLYDINNNEVVSVGDGYNCTFDVTEQEYCDLAKIGVCAEVFEAINDGEDISVMQPNELTEVFIDIVEKFQSRS